MGCSKTSVSILRMLSPGFSVGVIGGDDDEVAESWYDEVSVSVMDADFLGILALGGRISASEGERF